MEQPAIPNNEEERLKSLYSLNILDTPAEERFDRIARIAKKLLNVKVVQISLVDRNRQWFKSAIGLNVKETPRDISFCGHAIHEQKMFVVNNAQEDKRFSDNPLVTSDPHISFYAGMPLLGPNEQKVGTFCAIDDKPRDMTDDEIQILTDLSKWVELELNSEKLSNALEALKKKLEEVERLNKAMVGRELKMIELKAEIKNLKEKISGKNEDQ
jgi:GAF domain-containing protein